MKQVWKCDHCSHTNNDVGLMMEHEDKCSFNAKNKSCFTCKNYQSHGFEIGDNYCTKDLDYTEYEDVGNCSGWEIES